ncbi:MAG: hypothetical protein QOC82_964 [Frankiaceae bacterium]|jgi:hypothetical protein|nr:hypothetical protein [Frankiaceae bacterium]
MTRVVTAAMALVLIAATAAWAAGLTLSSTHVGAAALTTPAMFPVSVTLTNGTGGTAGKVQNGDTVTFVWSQLVDATSVCSGASNSLSTQSLTFQWSIVNGTGSAHDTLQATGSSASCATGLHVGVVDLGAAGYDTATKSIDFQTSTTTLSFGATTTTLTVSLSGQRNGTAGTMASGAAAIWTPDAAVKDRTGRTCGNNTALSSTTVQF